jgi:opacity protein-like surface antigen
MNRCRQVSLVMMLAMAVGSGVAQAANGSRISLKLGFGVNSYPSDRSIGTGFYPAIGGDPAHCDASGSMTYHFDVKFGRSPFGALCYRALKNVDLELGFGYTSIQMEIVQHEDVASSDVCWPDVRPFSYNTPKNSDFSYFLFRPGVTLFPASGSAVVLYVGIGLDVMRVSAKGNLDLGIPYVTEDAGRYYLSRRLEALKLEGSDFASGLDMRSGLEFKATEKLFIGLGFSYMFQFQKPFKDFGALVAPGSSPTAKSTVYYSEGMNVNNVAAEVSLRVRL